VAIIEVVASGRKQKQKHESLREVNQSKMQKYDISEIAMAKKTEK